MQNTPKTADTLRPGESGVILGVSGNRAAVRRRLVDMGLTPGTRISVTKIAPLGDPVELRLRNYELSVRREDLRSITVGDAPPTRTERSAGSVRYDTRRRIDPETLRRMQAHHEHELDEHHAHYDHDAHDARQMHIALAGNPNSGKTTLFNALTGSNQYVGNWPGVTVEKKEGTAKFGHHRMSIVDLPGIYSLSPFSMEEIVSRDYIIGGVGSAKPDAIINIVDVTNLERNLYLTVQLLELERPMVVALNFMDELRASGGEVDTAELSRQLGVPVVPISARARENLDTLLMTVHRAMHTGYTLEPDDLYDDFTHIIHHRIDEVIHDRAHAANLPAHWASIKLLEGDAIVEKALGLTDGEKRAVETVAREYETAGEGLGDRETLVADSRYAFIGRAVDAAVRKSGLQRQTTRTEKVDKIVTHRVLAIPLFLLMMFIMFNLTFGSLGSYLSDALGGAIDTFGAWAGASLTNIGVADWVVSLVSDGIIAGVGGVLTFLPQISLLFLCMSLLEDSGYMARAAFIMDRLLRRFGLSGKAFIPMLMGFGCAVPAVMGARTMESEKDRRMTILLVPFMSCAARSPIYAMITAAIFPQYAGVVIFGLYVLGIFLAVLSGIFFRKTLFRGEHAAFVMELPPYRLPKLRDTFKHIWERVRAFLVRAGTLIFLMSTVIWVLQKFTPAFTLAETPESSIIAVIGRWIAPIFKPAGFGTWFAAVALLTGLIAKEVVVSTLQVLRPEAFADGALIPAAAAALGFASPASALGFLVFVLLYVPCVAALGAIYREMNSLKWTLFSVAWQLGVAWVMSTVVYQVARVLIN
ncbi:MAG: ferrous iron transport protein B [Oscillospiraceae bacterium]|jgi:ferrous iron transport protein B|nr:ferrous iron transport protein B [Oscillospiraceae bacterium]